MSKRKGVLSKWRSRAKRGKGGKTIVPYLEALLQDPCVYCQEFGCDSLDHIIPVVRKDELVDGVGLNSWENLAPCHKRCNMIKGSKGIFNL